MKKHLKINIVSFAIMLLTFAGTSVCCASENKTPAVNKLTAVQITEEMTFGWNLGNTLDAWKTGNPYLGFYTRGFINAGVGTETGWGQPKTTQDMFKGLKASGINTVRIPVSWHDHITNSDYQIDPAWMERVKQIVDWAIEEEFFVIIDIHHDTVAPGKLTKYGNGYAPTNSDKELSKFYLKKIWTQICTTFNKDYDNHLIFETMNEPRLVGDSHEWNWDASCSKCKEAMDCINEYNQLCLDTIRASKGNNANRIVMVPSYVASPDAAFSSAFKIPTDSAKNRLALSVHMYTPYPFAMQSPGDIEFTQNHKDIMDYYFSTLQSKFISKGIGVIIGEMGATNKDNLQEREKWFSYFSAKTKEINAAVCLWDNGVWKITSTDSNRFDEHYGYYNRTAQEWYFPTLIEKAVNSRK